MSAVNTVLMVEMKVFQTSVKWRENYPIGRSQEAAMVDVWEMVKIQCLNSPQ